MSTKIVSLAELMKNNEHTIDVCGNDEPELIKEQLRQLLDKYDQLNISLRNIKNLSPSYAFRAFANLFNSIAELDHFDQIISFHEDEKNLSAGIKIALERKRRILNAEAHR
jgi:hypothetical protein